MIKLMSAAIAATLVATALLPISASAAVPAVYPRVGTGNSTPGFNQDSYWVQPYAGLAPPGLNDYEAASPGPISQFVPIAPLPGAAVGLAGPGIDDHVAACQARFRSYNPQTNLYLGYDGQYHHCNL